LYEIKWDSYRAIADLSKDDIELYSCNGNSFLNRYPVVVSAPGKIKHKAILDGEIVVLNEKGFPDFQKIQHYEDNTKFPIQYRVFDLLFFKEKVEVNAFITLVKPVLTSEGKFTE
jgi:bifunctional non-homologous end joining protein LigD